MAQVMPSGTLDPSSAKMPFLKGSRTCLEGDGSEVGKYSQIFDDEDANLACRSDWAMNGVSRGQFRSSRSRDRESYNLGRTVSWGND
jgi:hypothetical protein